MIRRADRTSDAQAMFGYRSQEPVARYGTSLPTSVEAFAPDHRVRNLVVESEGLVVGDLYCHINDAWAQTEVADRARGVQAEVGWALDPAQVGRGYATEAAAELIAICLAPTPRGLGLRRVYAEMFAANEASQRVCRRLGMRQESVGREDSLHRSGEWMDSMTFALLASEWAARLRGVGG